MEITYDSENLDILHSALCLCNLALCHIPWDLSAAGLDRSAVVVRIPDIYIVICDSVNELRAYICV